MFSPSPPPVFRIKEYFPPPSGKLAWEKGTKLTSKIFMQFGVCFQGSALRRFVGCPIRYPPFNTPPPLVTAHEERERGCQD